MGLRKAPLHTGLFAALAALALSFVLLRPVCELWFGHGPVAPASALSVHAQPGGDTAQCCATMSDSGVSVPLDAAFGGFERLPDLAPAGLFIAAFSSTLALRAALPRAAPPRTPQSYYLRSARILR